MLTILFMKIKEVVVGVTVQEAEVGLKISDNIPFTMMDKVLMVMVEVDIGLRPAPISPIIQVCLVNHWVHIFIATTEVYIGLIPANFIHMTTTDYTFPTQGFLKKLLQEVCKDKHHIKIILIIIIQECHYTLIQACHNILITKCHLILIQVCHHTWFVCVHISLLLLCMNRMQFKNTLIYHP